MVLFTANIHQNNETGKYSHLFSLSGHGDAAAFPCIWNRW
nr:MAG TPA: hypothetical protein [Caudoviricetes sp.]